MQVALGEMVELLTAKYDANDLPQGKLRFDSFVNYNLLAGQYIYNSQYFQTVSPSNSPPPLRVPCHYILLESLKRNISLLKCCLYRSTKGVGGTAPDMSEAQSLEDGLVVPLGKPKKCAGMKVCTRSMIFISVEVMFVIL